MAFCLLLIHDSVLQFDQNIHFSFMKKTSKNDTFIGIDIGGTKIHGIQMDANNNIVKEEKVLTEAHKGFQTVLKKLFEMVQYLKDKNTKAIGVGIAGPLDYEKGILYHAPNLPGWHDVNVKKLFEKELKIKTFIENDAKCFAIAEHAEGAGKGSRHMIGLTLGTGIGSGIIIDGELYRGRDNIAGEIGHMTIEFDGYQCSCGNQGCLESYASGTAITARTLRHIKKKTMSTKLKAEGLTARDIQTASRDGDPLAVHIMEDTGKYFGIGMANVINILNPDIIVLGGSAAKAFPIYKKTMFKVIKQRAFSPANEIKIVRKKLSSPGPLGAALVAKKRVLE